MNKSKNWKLIGIAFLSIFTYALLMYSTLGMDVNIEQYRLAIVLRGFGYGILAPTLMWALDESVPSIEQFFMVLFVFNIVHMSLTLRNYGLTQKKLTLGMGIAPRSALGLSF